MEPKSVSAGQVVSFKLKTKLLKDVFTNVTVVAADAAYAIASVFEDVAAIHANIISDLPEGTPRSHNEYNYIIVDLIDGTRKAVGIPWILGDVEVIQGLTVTVTLSNSSMETPEIVKRALNAYGLSDFKIDVKSTTL